MSNPTDIQPIELPATIRAYLAAHAAGEVDAAARTFAPTAAVTDEGPTYRGTEGVQEFLHKGGSQYTYTTELTGAERVDDQHWVAVNRLEGNFPGGVVDLRYRFTLADDLITELVIAP